MSDKELEEYFKTVEPNFNSHIEKGTIEMSNEYYNLLEERMARLINENQELKEELKAVNKGLRKVLSKRKKWKNRYYKEKMKNRKAIKHIKEKIQKSFNADYGLEPFKRTDRLFTETVIELQIIEQILDKGESNE